MTEKKLILVTRAGDFYISKEQAAKLGEAMNTKDFVNLGFAIISTKSVEAILGFEDYRQRAMVRGLKWKCQHGNIHLPTEHCACAKNNARPALPELQAGEPSAEQQARAQAMTEWTKKHLRAGTTAELKDKVKREQFVAERVAEILAEGVKP